MSEPNDDQQQASAAAIELIQRDGSVLRIDRRVPLINGLQALAARVASEFVQRGGRLLNNGEPLSPELLASPAGGLGPLLWMVREYADDYDLPFTGLRFYRNEDALSGFALSEVVASKDWAPMVLYTFNDFLRHEMAAENLEEVDLGPLFENFREWGQAQGASPEIAPAQHSLGRARQPE